MGSRLTNENTIASLYTEQQTEKTRIHYWGFVDPATNKEYLCSDNYNPFPSNSYVTDAYDPIGTRLADREIMDRLVRSSDNKEVTVDIVWRVYRDENGKRYYSYNNGTTFVPNTSAPTSNVLDIADPDDKVIIDGFEIVPGETKIELPSMTYRYDRYSVPGSEVTYYSRDGGKTFVRNPNYPDSTALDPVRDRDLISRLRPEH